MWVHFLVNFLLFDVTNFMQSSWDRCSCALYFWQNFTSSRHSIKMILINLLIFKAILAKNDRIYTRKVVSDSSSMVLPSTTTSEKTESKTTLMTLTTLTTSTTSSTFSTAPTTPPKNTTILILYDYLNTTKDNYLLHPDGGKTL